MRNRKEIETSGGRVELLQLEVLLDVRDLLIKDKPKKVKRVRKIK